MSGNHAPAPNDLRSPDQTPVCQAKERAFSSHDFLLRVELGELRETDGSNRQQAQQQIKAY